MKFIRSRFSFLLWLLMAACVPAASAWADHIKDMQTEAVEENDVAWGHWGVKPHDYSQWRSHSNRLIPIYTFGIGLDGFTGSDSIYRDAKRLTELYGREPLNTVNPQAEYCDQTDIFRVQQKAVKLGKKRIILFIFDGMDWQTTWAAAIYSARKVSYREGRGSGLFFQDYRGAKTDYGFMVTSPYCDDTKTDVNAQVVVELGKKFGGYDVRRGSPTPWQPAKEPKYLIGESKEQPQAYTDSSCSASSMTAGFKSYNGSVNVDPTGKQMPTIAHELQQQGWAIGVVTSVPIAHATPAATYAHNVDRDDYQDITRDLVGLPSISHRQGPLSGMDVVIGTGWGDKRKEDKDKNQGMNFVPGNGYITADDLQKIDVKHGGKYVVTQRTKGQSGKEVLAAAAKEAAFQRQRLFGFFGAKAGHLPFATADGLYDCANSNSGPAEIYKRRDLYENPVLADMAVAALEVLGRDEEGFWLMIEAGDVDWANHANNIDNSIGAVRSGDAAFRAVVDWIEAHGGWDNTALILTAYHGHYMFLDKPEALLEDNDASATAPQAGK